MRKGIQIVFLALTLIALSLPAVSCGGSGNSTPAGTAPATSGTGANPGGNRSPVISSFTAQPTTVNPETISQFRCNATDPDGDTLTYSWSATGGVFQTDAVSKQFWIDWRAPKFAGNFTVTVSVDDGRGGSATRTINMTIVTNRAPVIGGITTSPAVPKPGDTVTITCNATDPDGDSITFTWQSANGQVTSSGNNIGKWVAPATDGVYEVLVVVSDGKDNGQTNGSIKITVQTPSNSVTLSQVPGESGTVASNSDLSTSYRVGDDENNNGLIAYFSFDLSSLKGATINSASLNFTIKQTINNPWTMTPPFMYVEPVYYGGRALKGIDYQMQPSGATLDKLDNKLPGEYNVTGPVSDATSTGRYQVRVRMGGTTNSNKQADYVEFSGATLKITFQK